MSARPILGGDPGKSGALTLLRPDGSADIRDMPILDVAGRKVVDHVQLALIADEWASEAPNVWIEHVHAFQGEGGVGAFDFGKTYGLCIGVLAAHHMPIETVAPVRWKRAAGIPAGADKDVSRQRASALMPRAASAWPLKKHDGRAESALIALFGRQAAGTSGRVTLTPLAEIFA